MDVEVKEEVDERGEEFHRGKIPAAEVRMEGPTAAARGPRLRVRSLTFLFRSRTSPERAEDSLRPVGE
jgi:hypothetical protein